METVTVPESVCIDGEWFAAHWQLQAVDGGSGELLITASAAGLDLVLRMDMELAQDLRRQAGIEKPLPVDEARGELAYLRESVQFAVSMLAQGRTLGQDYRQAALNTESYLRQLLALDAEQEQPCYDVPHECNGVRLADLERDVMLHSQRLNGATERLATIERRQEKDAVTFGEHARRLDALESKLDRAEERIMQVDREGAQEGSTLAESLAKMEYTVRNLQRLAQSDHGPEAGL